MVGTMTYAHRTVDETDQYRKTCKQLHALHVEREFFTLDFDSKLNGLIRLFQLFA